MGQHSLDKESVKQIDVVALDFSKAFDQVPHEHLVLKLQYLYGIKGKTLTWIPLLCDSPDRLLVFVYDTFTCLPKWGTRRFSPGVCVVCSFMLDLIKCVKSNLLQYADDCTIFKPINSTSDIDELQNDLTNTRNSCE